MIFEVFKFTNVKHNKDLIISFINSLEPKYHTDSYSQSEVAPIARFHFNYKSDDCKYIDPEIYRGWLINIAKCVTERFALYNLELGCQELCSLISYACNAKEVIIKNWMLIDNREEWKIEIEQSKILKLAIEGLERDPEWYNYIDFYNYTNNFINILHYIINFFKVRICN